MRSALVLYVFYVIGFIISLVFVFSEKKTYREGYLSILSFTILALFFMFLVSLRPLDAGNDTYRYASTFDQLVDLETAKDVGEDYFGNSELGFWPFSYFFKAIGFDASMYLFSIATISFFLMAICARKIASDLNINFVFLFYCCLGSYLIVYLGNHVRASLAVPLVYLMFCSWREKNIRSSMLFGVGSIVLHYSSFLSFPFLAISSFRGRLFWGGFIIAMFLFSSFIYELVMSFSGLIPFISSKVDLYFAFKKEAEFDSIYGLTNFKIITFLILVIFVGFRDGFWSKLSFYWYGVILGCSVVPQVSERIFPFLLFVLPFALYETLSDRYSEKMVVLAIFSFFLLNLFLVFYSDSALYTLSLEFL